MFMASDDDDRPRRRRPDDEDEDRPRRRRPDPDDDDRPRRRRREPSGSGDGGVGYVIPYKNWPALAAYYIGIGGLLLCFIGLGPISGVTAVVFGFMGMSRASKNPDAHGRAHAIIGIVLGFVQILFGCAVDVGIVMSFLPRGR
jgi:hypothetical protein